MSKKMYNVSKVLSAVAATYHADIMMGDKKSRRVK